MEPCARALPDATAAEGLARLAGLLRAAPLNLVAAGDRAHVHERHVDECAAIGRALVPLPAGRWLDLGTGGGLPGLVLALQHPGVRWVLLDATRRKMEAVREFARELGLRNVEVAVGRAEALARGPLRGSFDGVVSRAVARLVVLAELARGFLCPGGRLVAVKGPAWDQELAEAGAGLELLGYGQPTVAAVAGTARPTWLVTIPAIGPPPGAFPRRDGVPRARPLLGRPRRER